MDIKGCPVRYIKTFTPSQCDCIDYMHNAVHVLVHVVGQLRMSLVLCDEIAIAVVFSMPKTPL